MGGSGCAERAARGAQTTVAALPVPVAGRPGAGARATVGAPAPRGPEAPPRRPAVDLRDLRFVFEDVTEAAGLATEGIAPGPDQIYLLDQLGYGAAFFDADGDGWLDLFVAGQSSWARWKRGENPGHRFYHNRGDGTFEDATDAAGLRGNHWGAGPAAADYDNDGDADLFVATTRGPDVLYRNEGGGRFVDVTAAAGVGSGDLMSLAAVFADFDRDGWLDLFVLRYISCDPDDLPDTRRGPGVPSCRARPETCEPHLFPPERHSLFRNVPAPDGGRRFEDVSATSGIDGARHCRGMGAVAADADGDGDDDLYLACDPGPNAYLENLGGWRFCESATELGLARALAENDDGDAANMGIAIGDPNRDGHPDFFVTDTQQSENTFFVYHDHAFEDRTAAAGLGEESHWNVAWGPAFADFDRDGAPDLIVANGGWFPLVDGDPQWREGFAQELRWYAGNGSGRFEEVHGMERELDVAGRAVVIADYDNDGDPDVLVTVHYGAPRLLRNTLGQANPAVVIDLVGTRSNRDAIGARVSGSVGAARLTRFRVPHQGYEASRDGRLRFGLGAGTALQDVEVVWPSGLRERLGTLAAGSYRIVEGQSAAEELAGGSRLREPR